MSLPCLFRTSWKNAIPFTKVHVCLSLSFHIGLNLICSSSYSHLLPLYSGPGLWSGEKKWSDSGYFFPFPISKLSHPSSLPTPLPTLPIWRQRYLKSLVPCWWWGGNQDLRLRSILWLFSYNCLHGDSCLAFLGMILALCLLSSWGLSSLPLVSLK